MLQTFSGVARRAWRLGRRMQRCKCVALRLHSSCRRSSFGDPLACCQQCSGGDGRGRHSQALLERTQHRRETRLVSRPDGLHMARHAHLLAACVCMQNSLIAAGENGLRRTLHRLQPQIFALVCSASSSLFLLVRSRAARKSPAPGLSRRAVPAGWPNADGLNAQFGPSRRLPVCPSAPLARPLPVRRERRREA